MPGVRVWETKRVLITVRTYPTPANKGAEVSCTAGITEDGKWIRLFPIPYRFLNDPQRFRKYERIEVRVAKASDPRPESYIVDVDSIKVVSDRLPSDHAWAARKAAVFPLQSPSLCALQKKRDADHEPTLGFFKPKQITDLRVEPCDPEWSPEELAKLNQQFLFARMPRERLEKIPYIFSYRFKCDDAACRGHELSCTDWELSQSYRDWSKQYGKAWEEKLRQKYYDEMVQKNDTHFYVGTVSNHPASWIIIGLFYPPKMATFQTTLPGFE